MDKKCLRFWCAIMNIYLYPPGMKELLITHPRGDFITSFYLRLCTLILCYVAASSCLIYFTLPFHSHYSFYFLYIFHLLVQSMLVSVCVCV